MRFSTDKWATIWADAPSAGLPMASQQRCWPPQDFYSRAWLSVSTAGAPDQLREKTAEETAAVKPNDPGLCRRESKTSRAVSVRLTEPANHDLTSFRAVTPPPPDRFIAGRPYGNSHQFVSGRIVSGDEQAKIQDGVVVSR
jgi:hypothetical protein